MRRTLQAPGCARVAMLAAPVRDGACDGGGVSSKCMCVHVLLPIAHTAACGCSLAAACTKNAAGPQQAVRNRLAAFCRRCMRASGWHAAGTPAVSNRHHALGDGRGAPYCTWNALSMTQCLQAAVRACIWRMACRVSGAARCMGASRPAWRLGMEHISTMPARRR